MIHFNTKFTQCGSEVCLRDSSVGIATSIQLTCKNQRYGLIEYNKLLNRTNYHSINVVDLT